MLDKRRRVAIDEAQLLLYCMNKVYPDFYNLMKTREEQKTFYRIRLKLEKVLIGGETK